MVLAKLGFRRPSEIVLCPGYVLSVWWLSPWLKFPGEDQVAQVQGRVDKCFQPMERFVRGVCVGVCVWNGFFFVFFFF